jgi:hypothetical protein
MKTSALILSIVLAASTMVNANFHLRGPTDPDQDTDNSLDWHRHDKKKKTDPVVPDGKWGFMGAAITITHVSDDETNLDEEKVGQAFIQAYNTVHDNGYRITTGFIDKTVVIPESADSSNLDFSTVIYYYPFGYDCPNCPTEFGLGGEAPEDSLEATAKPKPADDSKVHEKFENRFLKALRSSDMAAFADIETVHIVFTYTDPTTTATAADDESLTEPPRAETRTTKPSDTESMYGHIEITHMKADGSSSTVIDMKLLGEVYQQSFDAVYSVMGYQVTSFDLESEIDIPEEESDGDADETGEDNLESVYYFLRGIYTYTFGFGCTLCPNDDDLLGFSVDLVTMQESGAHRFFEKLFCHKMKKSGKLQFKEINHCSIDFDVADLDLDASFAGDGAGVISSPQ